MKEQAVEIVRRLQQAGHVAYFAGGSVRDQLLGKEAKDYDIATSAPPDEVQKLFPRVTDLTGKSFGVVRVLVGENSYEVATFRQDGPYRTAAGPRRSASSRRRRTRSGATSPSTASSTTRSPTG